MLFMKNICDLAIEHNKRCDLLWETLLGPEDERSAVANATLQLEKWNIQNLVPCSFT